MPSKLLCIVLLFVAALVDGATTTSIAVAGSKESAPINNLRRRDDESEIGIWSPAVFGCSNDAAYFLWLAAAVFYAPLMFINFLYTPICWLDVLMGRTEPSVACRPFTLNC